MKVLNMFKTWLQHNTEAQPQPSSAPTQDALDKSEQTLTFAQLELARYERELWLQSGGRYGSGKR